MFGRYGACQLDAPRAGGEACLATKLDGKWALG